MDRPTRQNPLETLLLVMVVVVVLLSITLCLTKIVHGQEQTKPITFLIFTATWCEYCPQMRANVKAASKQAGVDVLEVDIDRQDALQSKWGVERKVPTTFIVYKKDGKIVSDMRINGVASTADLVRYVNSAKNK